jgi:hypothetical protein
MAYGIAYMTNLILLHDFWGGYFKYYLCLKGIIFVRIYKWNEGLYIPYLSINVASFGNWKRSREVIYKCSKAL